MGSIGVEKGGDEGVDESEERAEEKPSEEIEEGVSEGGDIDEASGVVDVGSPDFCLAGTCMGCVLLLEGDDETVVVGLFFSKAETSAATFPDLCSFIFLLFYLSFFLSSK